MPAAVIQPFAQLPEGDCRKKHAQKKQTFSGVVPLDFVSLAGKPPQVKTYRQRGREADAGQRGEGEKIDYPGHQFAVGKQAAEGDNCAGQRRPDGVAAQPLPVQHGTF